MILDLEKLEKNNKYNMKQVSFRPADFGVFIFTLFNCGLALGLAILSTMLFWKLIFVIFAIINFLIMVNTYGRNNKN